LVKHQCFFLKGWPLAEKHSKLTIACQPKYDRLRCEDRGPLRGVLSDGLSMSPPRRGRSSARYFEK
jgi:hypothetical protein